MYVCVYVCMYVCVCPLLNGVVAMEVALCAIEELHVVSTLYQGHNRRGGSG